MRCKTKAIGTQYKRSRTDFLESFEKSEGPHTVYYRLINNFCILQICNNDWSVGNGQKIYRSKPDQDLRTLLLANLICWNYISANWSLFSNEGATTDDKTAPNSYK